MTFSKQLYPILAAVLLALSSWGNPEWLQELAAANPHHSDRVVQHIAVASDGTPHQIRALPRIQPPTWDGTHLWQPIANDALFRQYGAKDAADFWFLDETTPIGRTPAELMSQRWHNNAVDWAGAPTGDRYMDFSEGNYGSIPETIRSTEKTYAFRMFFPRLDDMAARPDGYAVCGAVAHHKYTFDQICLYKTPGPNPTAILLIRGGGTEYSCQFGAYVNTYCTGEWRTVVIRKSQAENKFYIDISGGYSKTRTPHSPITVATAIANIGAGYIGGVVHRRAPTKIDWLVSMNAKLTDAQATDIVNGTLNYVDLVALAQVHDGAAWNLEGGETRDDTGHGYDMSLVGTPTSGNANRLGAILSTKNNPRDYSVTLDGISQYGVLSKDHTAWGLETDFQFEIVLNYDPSTVTSTKYWMGTRDNTGIWRYLWVSTRNGKYQLAWNSYSFVEDGDCTDLIPGEAYTFRIVSDGSTARLYRQINGVFVEQLSVDSVSSARVITIDSALGALTNYTGLVEGFSPVTFLRFDNIAFNEGSGTKFYGSDGTVGEWFDYNGGFPVAVEPTWSVIDGQTAALAGVQSVAKFDEIDDYLAVPVSRTPLQIKMTARPSLSGVGWLACGGNTSFGAKGAEIKYSTGVTGLHSYAYYNGGYEVMTSAGQGDNSVMRRMEFDFSAPLQRFTLDGVVVDTKARAEDMYDDGSGVLLLNCKADFTNQSGIELVEAEFDNKRLIPTLDGRMRDTTKRITDPGAFRANEGAGDLKILQLPVINGTDSHGHDWLPESNRACNDFRKLNQIGGAK